MSTMSSIVPTDGADGQTATTTHSPPPTQFYHTSKGQVPLLISLNYPLWSKSLEKLWQIVDGFEQAPDPDDNAAACRPLRATAGPSSTPVRASAALPIPDQQADFANRQDTAAL